MFWVVIREGVGLVGVVLPDRMTGDLTNDYIEDDKYKILTGKDFFELSSMYNNKKRFKDTDLFKYLNSNFNMVNSKITSVLSFYKFENK